MSQSRIRRRVAWLLLGAFPSAGLAAEIVSLRCEVSPPESALVYQRLVWQTNGEPLAPGMPLLSYDRGSARLEADFKTLLPKQDTGCYGARLVESSKLKNKKIAIQMNGEVEVGRAESALVFYYPLGIEEVLHGARLRQEHRRVLDLIAEARQLGIRLRSIDELEETTRLDLDRARGLRLFDEGEYEEAIRVLSEVHRHRELDADVDFTLAKAQYKLSNYHDAEQRLQRMYRDNPGNKEALLYLGLVYLSKHDPARAARFLEDAVAFRVRDSHFYLGVAFYDQKRYRDALDAFEDFLSYGDAPGLVERADEYVARLRRSEPPRTAPPPPARPAPPPPRIPGAIRSSVYDTGITLSGFRQPSKQMRDLRRKVTVVHMWATWCIPCRDEIPSLVRFYETRYPELEDQGLELVTLNMDYTEAALARYVEEQLGADVFPVYWDPNWKVSAGLGITSSHLPKTILVGRDGRIRDLHIGKHDWQDPELLNRFRELLEERAP